MARVFIVADDPHQMRELSDGLCEHGLRCSVASNEELSTWDFVKQPQDVILLAMDGFPDGLDARHRARTLKERSRIPILALLSRQALRGLDADLPCEDFVIEPWEPAEVAIRVKRTLARAKGVERGALIECGDLVIDTENCEVTVGGRLVTLTFKEYELLKFLASNRGRVFSREALLNEVWGYDYFGGDRTVDVHVRRLRGKIEDPARSFVETVRNMGYRFKRER